MKLIQRQTINVDAPTLNQRQVIDVDSTSVNQRCSTSSFQRPSNFQIQPYFNVVSTLRSDVDSTLIQR